MKVIPPGMLWGTGALVAAGLALTVFAGPLFDFADRAAGHLQERGPYLEAVLGPHPEVTPERGGGAP